MKYDNRKWVLFLVGLLVPVLSFGQTTLTTVYSPLSNSSGGGTNGSITFALENTTAGPMQITDMGYYMPSNTTRTWSLWYRAGPITGAPAPISVANGWTEITTPATVTSTTAGIMPVLSNINFNIPANTTYWFAIVGDASSINYGGSNTAPNIFSGGGVNLLVGDNNPQGTGHVGYAGAQASLPFDPRFFRGSVTFIPATPCDDPSISFPSTSTSTVDMDTVCPGTTVELTAGNNMPGASGVTFQWQTSDAPAGPWTNFGTPQMGVDFSTVVNTSSYFRAEVYCNTTLELVTDPVQVFVVDPGIVQVQDSFRCGEGSVALGATPTPNTVLAWYADSTGGLPLTFGESFTTPYLTETDTFYVSAGIAIAEGDTSLDCETSREMVIATLLPKPELNLGNDINICIDKGEYIMLNAGVHPYDPEYLWDDATTSQILGVDSSGFHYVTVTNSYNCASSDSINVVLRYNPEVDLGQDTSVCAGSEVTLHAGTDGINYFWNTGDIDSVITVSDSGVYNVIVTNAEGCTKADTIVVHMNGDPPVVQGIIVDNLDRYTFKFEAFNPQNVMGYEWDFGDGTPFAYEAAPVHTYADEGHYIVTLRINSSCGFWGDAVSANVVSVADVDPGKDQLKVYPNPASGQAKILNASVDLKMERVLMFDALGREVYKRSADSDREHTIYFEDLSDGIYTIKILMDKGMVYRKVQILN